MKVNVFDATGKKQEVKELRGSDFAPKLNRSLLAQALRIYESNSHQNTSKVKTRGEVTGSRIKIWRQKGTGRARHGDRYAPIFVGGGVAHGPTGLRPQNLKLPKKMKRRALGTALAYRLKDNALSLVKNIEKIEPKTTHAAKLLRSIADHPQNKVLIVTDEKHTNLYQAMSNLQKVQVKRANLINAQDVVSADHIILTLNALEDLKKRVKSSQRNVKPEKEKKQ